MTKLLSQAREAASIRRGATSRIVQLDLGHRLTQTVGSSPSCTDRAMKLRHLAAAALAAALLPVPVSPAWSADIIVHGSQPLQADTPCADARVLKRISQRFDHQVRNVPGLPPVAILSFHEIRQHRFLPAHEDSPIARLYCNATVALSDGHSRKAWYRVEDGQGFAGIGDNVEFCVAGFDRWNVYDSGCRILR